MHLVKVGDQITDASNARSASGLWYTTCYLTAKTTIQGVLFVRQVLGKVQAGHKKR